MKYWCAALTIWFAINTYFIFQLYDYHRAIESNVNKVIDNTNHILSNEGYLIYIEKEQLGITTRNYDLFKGLLPKPDCINVLDEPQFRKEFEEVYEENNNN